MKKISTVVFGLLLVVLAFGVPANSYAQSAALAYRPQTNSEMIAYLYGRISQLLEIQAQLSSGGSTQNLAQAGFDMVTAETRGATEVNATDAVLRGEVVLYGNATAITWFEYGQDQSFLDQKSSKVNVKTAYDRAVRVKVTKLIPDKRYYFRIAAQDKNGTVTYGPVYGFRTDESTK